MGSEPAGIGSFCAGFSAILLDESDIFKGRLKCGFVDVEWKA
jgi:hypothetical protein